MPTIDVTRTYLEMKAPPAEPAPAPPAGVRLEPIRNCPWHLYRYLYTEVGRAYHWIDRLPWSDDDIRAYLNDPAVTLWLMTVAGAPAAAWKEKIRGEVMGGESRDSIFPALTDHCAHHRGALSILARLRGLEPQMPYG